MAEINFPNASTQTPENIFSPTSEPMSTSNGMTYKWENGYWKALDKTVADDVYVKLKGDSNPQRITGSGGLEVSGRLKTEGTLIVNQLATFNNQVNLPGGGGTNQAVTRGEVETMLDGLTGDVTSVTLLLSLLVMVSLVVVL